MDADAIVSDTTLADAPAVDASQIERDVDALKVAAEIIHPGVGRTLYAWWKELNEQFFGRQLTPPGIQFGLIAHGSALGKWRGAENVIILHRSLLRPAGNAWGFAAKLEADGGAKLFCRDVLLHEMIHQYIESVRGLTSKEQEAVAGTSSHNNPFWVREILRISPMLGLNVEASVIRQKRVDGKVTWYVPDGHLTMKELSTWPHCVTCREWYTEETESRQSNTE